MISLWDVYAAAFIGCLAAITVYQIGDRMLWRFLWSSMPGHGMVSGHVATQGPDRSKAKTCDKCGCVYMPDLADRDGNP